MTTLNSIGGEVPAIDRKHLVKILGLGHGYERGVCQIHRLICILLHQLKGAVHRFRIEKPQGEAAVRDEMDEICCANAARGEQVALRLVIESYRPAGRKELGQTSIVARKTS